MIQSQNKVRFILFWCFLSVFIFAVVANAQIGNNKILGNVRVEGNTSIDADLIKLLSELLPLPKDVYGEDFSNAVKLLWELDSFSDIQIYADNPEDKIINVVIKVKEYPSLNSIQFVGNDKTNDEKMRNLVNLYPGSKISPSRVHNNILNIKSDYTEKGYLLAEINAQSVLLEEENKVDLVFNINEGEKVKIKSITFEGNENYSDKNLRKQFDKTKQDGLFRGGDYDKVEYEDDKKKLIRYYNKEGYRDASIISDSISFSDDKKQMHISVRIDEGIRYYFRNITYEGNDQIEAEVLQEIVNINKGDIYNYEKLVKSQDAIQQVYYNNGHLFTQIVFPERPVGVDSVDVRFVLFEGVPVKVNRVNIIGNTKTKEKVIRREIDILPGDIFNYTKVERSIRDLSILNYFGNLDFDVDVLDTANVDVQFIVEEKSTDTANMSAGFSQRDGLIGSLGLSMNNFMGNGQQMSIDWQFGKIFRSFRISFTEPYLFDTNTLAGFSVFDIRRGGEFYGYDQESKGATIHFGKRLRWPDNFFRGDWFFEFSKNNISNIRSDLDLQRFLISNSTRVSVSQIISRDSRSNYENPGIAAEFPANGSTLSISAQFSGGPLGGSEDFMKYRFNTEWYTPAIWGFVLYNNMQLGFIHDFSSLGSVSPQELFFMGGSALSIGTSLRGYKERSVGPTSRDGFALGGKTMIKVSTELRFNMSQRPTIYGLFFAETGNNWRDITFTDPFDLKRSVGAGIRLFMPMLGMIGFDIGFGFDNFDAFGKREGWLPHFQFGRGF
ncbi:outer membrane protein assembly factor BamA [candidate division KSB1 bacterium]|nr:outer membrane protein assembly factor BamA [candidate division KSB1 bacterium]